MEHGDLFPADRVEPDLLDLYLNSADENGVNKLDIIYLFGKEKLENIQKSLSKATGLAFVTVDFRGEPITESTSFCHFCSRVRNDPSAFERCKSSDAFGSIQAAVTKKTNVYFCPCGLLEVAIPIIVRGHYLGGFIGGQIRCNDAPDTVSRLSSVMHSNRSEESIHQYQDLMDEIPVYSYEKFLDIANLVFLVINQLTENEISQHVQEDALKKKIKKCQSLNQRYLKENMQKTRELQEAKVNCNEFEILDLLTSLMNLSIIEHAPRTSAFLGVLTDYARYKYAEKGTFVPLADEVEQAVRYLALQQEKLGDRLAFSIQIPAEMQLEPIPTGILLPFVKNAVYNGVMLQKEGGMVTIRGTQRGQELVLEVMDNGPGISQAEIDIRYELYKDMHEGYFIDLGMQYAREKVKQLFGDAYNIVTESSHTKGCKSTLILPEHHEEGIE